MMQWCLLLCGQHRYFYFRWTAFKTPCLLRLIAHVLVISDCLYTLIANTHRIMSGFHGAFATGVASQQGTLTLPDTWFRPPFWDLLMLQLLRPNSSNLPGLYSTFHLEYPLVLSWFYFEIKELPRVDRTRNPVGDDKIKTLVTWWY